MTNGEPRTHEDQWIGAVEAIIAELNEVDANSELFRFGVDEKLRAYDRRVEHLDMVNARCVMDKLANGLEGCDTWHYETQQARWEYEAEMRQEYETDMRDYYGSPSDYY